MQISWYLIDSAHFNWEVAIEFDIFISKLWLINLALFPSISSRALSDTFLFLLLNPIQMA